MPLYHTSNVPLEPGTVLESRFGTDEVARRVYQIVFSALREGEWGMKSLLLADALSAARQKGDGLLPMFLKEAVFEAVRTSEFADSPPRLGGCFLCPTIDDARKWQKHVGDRPHVHVCQVVGGRRGRFDLTLARQTDSLEPIRLQIQDLTNRARQYWKGDADSDPIWEIVTDGKVTITELLAG